MDFSEKEVSSMDAIGFVNALAKEFNHEILVKPLAKFKNLSDAVSYLYATAKTVDLRGVNQIMSPDLLLHYLSTNRQASFGYVNSWSSK